jgi:RHS repeat-associated protein
VRIRILAGQYYDAETGLHYNYHRYYDPSTGRYLTPDPIGLLGGINRFVYAGNNPINAVDPLGLLDAKSAYNYWTAVGTSGASRALNGGGWDAVVGNSQAAGAAIMSSFIDFFGARALQTNAELSGQYSAIEGCEGEAWKYGGLAFGQIAFEAGAASGLMRAGKYSLKLGRHGAHHYFKMFGRKLPHLQINTWIKGVRRSGKAIRIPWPF